jgi:hypothetical protein
VQTGVALDCLMVDETEILIGFEEVALPQKILKTLGRLKPAAKMKGSPQQSCF